MTLIARRISYVAAAGVVAVVSYRALCAHLTAMAGAVVVGGLFTAENR
jgi:hypothetical protein